MVCPAECSVLMYGPGFPIEQTRSRTGDVILEETADGEISEDGKVGVIAWDSFSCGLAWGV